MIFFRTIRWKNFLSTGNQPTRLKLNDHSTTLIIGSNGAGKSTVLDALTFVLYGKAFRKINKAQMIKIMSKCDDADTLTRLQKFEVFCRVCDNMLNEGRISKANHKRWTEIW